MPPASPKTAACKAWLAWASWAAWSLPAHCPEAAAAKVLEILPHTVHVQLPFRKAGAWAWAAGSAKACLLLPAFWPVILHVLPQRVRAKA